MSELIHQDFTFVSAGPFPVLCLMIGSVVTRFAPDEGPPISITAFENLTIDAQRVLVASSVTFLVGVMQVGNLSIKKQFLALFFNQWIFLLVYLLQ